MAAQLGSLAGWYFLPPLVTGYVQSGLYTFFTRVGDAKPAPGSPRYVSDRRKIQIFVILVYLAYTIYEADYQLRQAGDFYSQLGVPFEVNEKGILGRFRRLTVQYHPDKVAASERSHVEAIFVHLKLARDTLLDPAKRFAYDRLGPEVLQWQTCKTVKDFVMAGVRNTTIYYIGTATALLITGLLGYLQSGKFWRFLALAGMFVVEITIMTRPAFPAVLSSIVNPVLTMTRLRDPLLPFQLLVLLRKLVLTMFIAISQLEPLLRNPRAVRLDSDAASQQQFERVKALSVATDQELTRLYGFELAQYGVDHASEQALRESLKEWLVSNTVRNDPELRAAMSGVFDQRRGQIEST